MEKTTEKTYFDTKLKKGWDFPEERLASQNAIKRDSTKYP